MAKEQNQQQHAQKEFMTVHEVASSLRVDDTTVRRWIKNGALESIVLPHQGKRCTYRIPKSSYDKLFSEPATRKQAS